MSRFGHFHAKSSRRRLNRLLLSMVKDSDQLVLAIQEVGSLQGIFFHLLTASADLNIFHS